MKTEELNHTRYRIERMDCPCEEQLVRMKLESIDGIRRLEFDLPNRTLDVWHCNSETTVTEALHTLNLNTVLSDSAPEAPLPEAAADDDSQRHVLWAVLGINAALFLVEVVSGLLARSMGLVADSLDMLADAAVYGMSLMVVGTAVARKKKVARRSGRIQMALALWGLFETFRRFVGTEQMPRFEAMIGVSLLALIANAVCLWLLHRTRSTDAHMRASLIFSANDVIINAGVIVAGGLVWLWGSRWPDLAAGLVIFGIVLRGAVRIMRLGKE